MGVYGSALMLVLSNLFEFVWIYKHSNKLYNMGLQWKPIGIMSGIIILFLVAGKLMPNGEVSYFIIRLLLFLALILAIYKLPIWEADESEMMVNTLKKIKSINIWSK